MSALVDAGAAVLRCLPPEAAHRATLALLGLASPLIPDAAPDDPRLAVIAFGLRFANPVGLAAGFDKDARVADTMLKLGFGFVECGTLTPKPQSGNARPRLFRLVEDNAVINRMGFNNCGAIDAAARLGRRLRNGILGLNIGANKVSADRITDYKTAFIALAPFADFITVNVSSPNTPGLRDLQKRDELARLLDSLVCERAARSWRTPLLLKIAPDVALPDLDEIVAVALQAGIEGMIVSNTTITRSRGLKSPRAQEAGGLSGAPLFAPSTELLRQTRARTGSKLTLIGVGGISSGADALAKIRAGATLVQLYTGLALHGPGLIAQIKQELLAQIEREEFSTIGDAVGADVTRVAGAESCT